MKIYFKNDLIFKRTNSNCSSESFILGLLKFISSMLLMGIKCMCVCGTSSPMTVTPILLHGTACFNAAATFLAKTINHDNSSSPRSKI